MASLLTDAPEHPRLPVDREAGEEGEIDDDFPASLDSDDGGYPAGSAAAELLRLIHPAADPPAPRRRSRSASPPAPRSYSCCSGSTPSGAARSRTARRRRSAAAAADRARASHCTVRPATTFRGVSMFAAAAQTEYSKLPTAFYYPNKHTIFPPCPMHCLPTV